MTIRVGLVDVDSKIPNIALMKLSAWHKKQGDDVEIAAPLWGEYDLVYRSKVFDFTEDDGTPWNCPVVSGGTGYSLTSQLPVDDTIYPDYRLFNCEYALGRITRGCVRRCPWCIVWRQDGRVRQVAELTDFMSDQTHLRLLDDNLTAIPALFIDTCKTLSELGVRTSFEALDIRLMDDEMCAALMSVKRWGNLRFAWDSMDEEDRVIAGLERLKNYYPALHDVMVYVLIGFDTTEEEDVYRVEKLRDLGALPYAMPYTRSEYEKRFCRWVNAKAAFRSCSWAEYQNGMGHGYSRMISGLTPLDEVGG